jgi:hypothetical protein
MKSASELPETRKAAKAMKSTTYLGKPCKMGHNEGRLTSNGECIICHRGRVSKDYFASRVFYADPVETPVYAPLPPLPKPKRIRRKPGWSTLEHP